MGDRLVTWSWTENVIVKGIAKAQRLWERS
jgi:hypothetical protein